jgi:O-antigen/teichoic acid export membrane protein
MLTEPSLETQPRPLTTGAAMGAASRIAAAAAGGITTIVLARVLGPDGWASYFVAQSLMAILLASTTLGIQYGIVYYVSSARWGASAAFVSALKFALCMGAVGAAVGLGARLAFPSAFAGLSIWLTAVVLVGLPFALAGLYTSFVALAIDRYEVSMSLPAIQAVLVLALSAPAAVGFGLRGAVVGMTLGTIAVGVGSVVWGRQRLGRGERSEPGQLRRAMSFGIKGYGANALQLVSYRLDLFVLSAVASTAVVGGYSLAVALTSLLWLLPGALSTVLFPRVARLSHGDEESAREMVESKSLRHVSLITVLSTLVLAAGLVLLVVPLFGDGFQPAISLGLILLPGTAAIGISGVLAATVVGRGKPAYALYCALAVTPFTVVLYATLIPWLEARGAALASTVSYFATFLLWCVLYQRTTGRRVLPLLLPTRSELDDLRALPGATAAWIRQRG